MGTRRPVARVAGFAGGREWYEEGMAHDEPGFGLTEFAVTDDWIDETTVVVTPEGDVDLHTAPQLRERLNAVIGAGASRVVVDLQSVSFIDSMALGVLLGASKRLKPAGGQLCIATSDPGLRKIFEITLLDRIFALRASREDALADPAPGTSA